MRVTETDWGQGALAFIKAYPGRTFSANDLWAAGLPVPANRMWLGLVLRQAAKEGAIRRVGLEGTTRGHGGIIMRWEQT